MFTGLSLASILDEAGSVVTALLPVITIVAAAGIGFGVVRFTVSQLKKAR